MITSQLATVTRKPCLLHGALCHYEFLQFKTVLPIMHTS